MNTLDIEAGRLWIADGQSLTWQEIANRPEPWAAAIVSRYRCDAATMSARLGVVASAESLTRDKRTTLATLPGRRRIR